MALLQPKLSLKVQQRQILTPGLMQMVSVLALNKLELKEMTFGGGGREEKENNRNINFISL